MPIQKDLGQKHITRPRSTMLHWPLATATVFLRDGAREDRGHIAVGGLYRWKRTVLRSASIEVFIMGWIDPILFRSCWCWR